jgi:hypothetical protein
MVREGIEFTSLIRPRWNPRWASRINPPYHNVTKYDETGRKVSEAGPDACGVSDFKAVQETFDSKGRIVQRVTFNLDGSLRNRVSFSHNSKGWVKQTSAYDKRGMLTSRWSYKYILDSRGNWIGQIPFCQEGCAQGEDRALPVLCRAITYW